MTTNAPAQNVKEFQNLNTSKLYYKLLSYTFINEEVRGYCSANMVFKPTYR